MNKTELTAELWLIFVVAMIQAASRDPALVDWGDQTHSLGRSFELEVKVEVAGSPMNYPRR